jgi:hypothetical protein
MAHALYAWDVGLAEPPAEPVFSTLLCIGLVRTACMGQRPAATVSTL